jgi:hypothetical protein
LRNCCGSASNSNNRSMAGSLLSYRAPRNERLGLAGHSGSRRDAFTPKVLFRD